MNQIISSFISRRSVGLTILILAVAGLALIWAGNEKLSSTGSALRTSIASITGLLEARSPGERTTAELTKAKLRDRGAAVPSKSAQVPTERVLGKIFLPEMGNQPAASSKELLSLPTLFLPPAEMPIADEGTGQLISFFPSGPVFGGGGGFGPPSFIGGGGSGGGGSGGGGGGGGSGGGIPSIPPPDQIPAVPEPSTWVLMLIGAAMCGASMRRQRRAQLQALA
ncbi:PEPxxWA-CTERM sorting domain-containing protein [Altererythrobacter sp. SALINAS58]|uniref:PEPxxWA-CTERM sorting domain-containing protein n=1 Tax=Alteripontixanthobacter muriae TaxID=2705546 RepID=UPI00157711F9|nr:PEPxxWA-CTERM sorting domain-containing protein [Alteripontixanthobacter muriae]